MNSSPLAKLIGDTPDHDHGSMPNTALAHAFLDAILHWAERQAGIGRVAIPTGSVDAGELRQVIFALLMARSEPQSLGKGDR